jgi:hypothetical protein
VAQEDRLDVPVHVIGPADLVERVGAWGFAPGLTPPEAQEALPMEAMRDLVVTTFSSGVAP